MARYSVTDQTANVAHDSGMGVSGVMVEAVCGYHDVFCMSVTLSVCVRGYVGVGTV